MLDLTIATLNMQIIALGVFFGMLTAWTVRWVWLKFAGLVGRGARAAYRFWRKKHQEYKVARESNTGKATLVAGVPQPGKGFSTDKAVTEKGVL